MNIFKKSQGKSEQRGFTLIELLVVIAIIALLTGIIIANLAGSKQKSRDAKRASDLAQIQLAIEQYFDRCGQYPSNITNLSQGTGICPTGVNLGSFISVMPTDPSTASPYGYATNSQNGAAPTDYVIYTTFEAPNSTLAQSAPNPTWFPSSTSFNCFNTETNPKSSSSDYDYCVRPN